MRIDKFLKVSRILKRRSSGKDACDGGKVLVNGKESKPAKQVQVGDVVELIFSKGSVKFEITDIKETVKKDEAALMYRIISEDNV